MNIIVQLQGGLGNQLFQYATARALAHQHQATLLLDQSWFTKAYDDVTPRELLISLLNTKGALISLDSPPKRPKRIRRILQKLWPINPFVYFEKNAYYFDPSLLKAPAFKTQNLYLMGYWQSYRYFESIKKILQSEVSPKFPLDAHYQNYLNQIQASRSAMVHVRRGDYVHLASAAKVHGFIGLDYYQQGMEALLLKNPETQFFVFSDDLDWAKENLPHQDKITFIKSLEKSDAVIQELELMTHCQNHLIANSSLSWWAAWLAKSVNNTVICPSRWTNDPTKNWDDLLPANWQRI
jgi:hypothetical protein